MRASFPFPGTFYDMYHQNPTFLSAQLSPVNPCMQLHTARPATARFLGPEKHRVVQNRAIQG